MPDPIKEFLKNQLKKDLPDIRPGDTVRVYQKPQQAEEEPEKKKAGERDKKEKARVFEGVVLAQKHGKGINATLTVRKVVSGVGVEMVFPLHSPTVEKIELVKRGKVRRAKLYYLRERKGKRAELKEKETKTT